MAVIHCLWLMIVCWTVGDVYSQTFLYVSFMGQTLADHSYVDLSQVGRPELGGDSVLRELYTANWCTLRPFLMNPSMQQLLRKNNYFAG